MLNEVRSELISGKKVYLFEVLSVFLFSIFLGIGANVEVFSNNPLFINAILIGWLLVNSIVITVYALHTFIKIIFKEEPLTAGIGRTILYKVLLFTFWFAINSFIFLKSSGMIIPIIALGITFLVLAYSKEYFPSKKGLLAAGIMWFGALFIIIYLSYPLLFLGLNAIIPNITIITIIANLFLIGLATFIFFKVIKKTTFIYSK